MSLRSWEQFETGQALRGGLLRDLVAQAAPVEVPSGTRFGAWEIVSLLGSGGMANVYLARRADGQFEQQVALKLVRRDAAHTDRLRHERQIVATLRHPHLVSLIDGGETDAGELWFAMTLVEGVTIDRYVDQQRLHWTALLHLFDAVCAAVEYAHGRALVHRDIKPANILVDQQGHPRLLDFGIALADGGDGQGDRVLTQRYASPEQLAGDSITTASDIFQLGRVLDGLLDAPGLKRIPRAVRADLDRVCAQATATRPAQRHATVTALRDDLARVLQRRPLAQDRHALWLRAARLVERNKVTAVALALLVLCLGAALLLAWRGSPWQVEAVVAPMLDEGYGLQADDLHAALPDTPRLLQEALRNESRGDPARARDLLQALHNSDPRTPLPAIYLALWSMDSNTSALTDRQWLDEARKRSHGLSGLYLPLLIDYVNAEIEGSPDQIIRAAGVLLDLRPNAWRLRQARAHLMEFSGMRDAALFEIQQIEVTELGNNKHDLALADRGSMGDVEGAQAMLDRLPASQDPMMHAYLSGRLAWSRRDFNAARRHFLAAAGVTYEIARVELHANAQLYASVIDVLEGREDEAIARIEQTRHTLAGRSRDDEVDLSLFLAELHAEAGRGQQAREALERALADGPPNAGRSVKYVAEFAAWRLRPGQPPDGPAPEVDASSTSLWRAEQAFAAGNQSAARAALQEAQQRGVDNTRLADEARWLALKLGMQVTPQSVLDPPHWPLSRVVLRRQIRRALAAQGLDPGPELP